MTFGALAKARGLGQKAALCGLEVPSLKLGTRGQKSCALWGICGELEGDLWAVFGAFVRGGGWLVIDFWVFRRF